MASMNKKIKRFLVGACLVELVSWLALALVLLALMALSSLGYTL